MTKVIKVSIILLSCYIFITVVNLLISGFLINLFYFLIILALMLASVCMIGYCLFYVLKQWKQKQWKSALPLLLNGLLLWLLLFQPFSPLLLKAGFHLKHAQRMEAVHLAQSNELRPADYNAEILILPTKYYWLSDGGEIETIGKKIMFYDVRGVTDNFSGFIYSPDGSKPTKEEVMSDIIYIEQLDKHWYYISCT